MTIRADNENKADKNGRHAKGYKKGIQMVHTVLPPIITTVRDIINIAAVSNTIPTSTERMASTLFKSVEHFVVPKEVLKNDSPQSPNRHSKSSVIMGKNVKAQIKTPHIPTLERSSDREAVTVESASDKTPPATGTVEPTRNFAVFRERLSAVELTVV